MQTELKFYGRTGLWLATYADALWARHAIFLPHERRLKRMGYLIRPITAHFPIKALIKLRARRCKKQNGGYLRGVPTGLRNFPNRRFESLSARSYGIFREEKGGRLC